jgi:hypothetical protein
MRNTHAWFSWPVGRVGNAAPPVAIMSFSALAIVATQLDSSSPDVKMSPIRKQA